MTSSPEQGSTAADPYDEKAKQHVCPTCGAPKGHWCDRPSPTRKERVEVRRFHRARSLLVGSR